MPPFRVSCAAATAAIHQHVAALGHRVLDQPTLSLDIDGMWSPAMAQGPAAAAAAPVAAAPYPAAADAAALQAQQFFSAAGPTSPMVPTLQHQVLRSQHPHPLLQPPQQQLSFGPVPSGLLFSSGRLPSDAGLSLFDL